MKRAVQGILCKDGSVHFGRANGKDGSDETFENGVQSAPPCTESDRRQHYDGDWPVAHRGGNFLDDQGSRCHRVGSQVPDSMGFMRAHTAFGNGNLFFRPEAGYNDGC